MLDVLATMFLHKILCNCSELILCIAKSVEAIAVWFRLSGMGKYKSLRFATGLEAWLGLKKCQCKACVLWYRYGFKGCLR